MAGDATGSLGLLSAMITPAVLISACGTLIFSTAARLARIVDRVRNLARQLEQLVADPAAPDRGERIDELRRQLSTSAERGRLVQASLTSLYVAVGSFVAATMLIPATLWLERLTWLPGIFGVFGTLCLFVGSLQLIRETRLALASVNAEMEFVLRRSRSEKPPPRA
jgi:hypothetical protein